MIEQEEKRKRGRPRKNPIEKVDQTTPPVKRGRGRPRKSESAVALTAAGDSKNKKSAQDLEYKPVNAWDNPVFTKNNIMAFSENYKIFMNKAKTNVNL